MSKEVVSWLCVLRPIERVYERDALVVEAGDDDSMNVQFRWSLLRRGT